MTIHKKRGPSSSVRIVSNADNSKNFALFGHLQDLLSRHITDDYDIPPNLWLIVTFGRSGKVMTTASYDGAVKMIGEAMKNDV